MNTFLEKIRINSVRLCDRHTRNHLYYKGVSIYFEIPTIILSVFAGSFSVGSNEFMPQQTISVTTCIISMIITILTSIKLYMKITESATAEQELAVAYKLLALEIFKHLSLEDIDREFIHKSYTKYLNLIENSSIISPLNKKDELLVLKPLFRDNEENGSVTSEESMNIFITDSL